MLHCSFNVQGFRKICSDLYKEYEDSYFGTEVFSQIDLCAMRKKKQESGYYYCECSINVGSSGTEENKEQEMQTEDIGDTTNEDLPNSTATAGIGATAASCKLASYLVVANDKSSENSAEASTASKEKETDDVKGQPEATEWDFPCSWRDLLQVSTLSVASKFRCVEKSEKGTRKSEDS